MDPLYVASLEATLKQTLVADTAVIKQASTKLTKEFYTNNAALPSLFHILQNAQDDQLKQLASVEARKLVLSKWENVDASLKAPIREAMLNNTFNQQSKLIRHSSARVVAAIAEIDLDGNQWPELLPALIAKVQDSNVQTKEMAVFTLFILLETQNESLIANTEDFLNLFSSLLTDQSSREIRVNSVLAFDTLSAFIENQPEINTHLANKFKSSIPIIIEVLKEVIQAEDTEKAKEIFNVLNSFIFCDNKLIGNYLIDLIKFAGELGSNKDLDEEIRVFSLQFLISVVNIRKSKILSSNIGPDITLIGLKVASEEIDVEEELDNEDEENENEENSPATLGLRLIAMLSAELPPSQVIQPILSNVEAMSNSSNQFERRAAILSIGVASSGAPDFLAIQINKIVPLLIKSLKDGELVVRVAGLKALTQLTSELQDVVTAYHEQFLPLLIDIIDSATSVAVYKYACSALDGLIEFLSHDSVDKYIEPLMNKLVSMLQTANTSSLKCAIVSAIGSTAYSAGKKFIPFFKQSITFLEPFLANVAQTEGLTEDDIELRALTFENISTMARAVGRDAFSDYATPLVEAAYQSLSSDHSRIRESGFAFISNMAKVYGEQFSGFLDKIIPEILKCLQQEEFTFNFDGEDEEELDLEDDEDLGNKLNVNTGITYEKEVAAIALGELAIGTGKDFYKYVEESFKILAEQVENSYGMREASMGTLFKIVKALFVAEHGEKFKYPKGVCDNIYINQSIFELVKNIRMMAIDNLVEEYEITMVACILDNLGEIIHKFGSIAIIDPSDQENLSKLCQQLMMILTKQHPCQLEDDEEIPSDEQDSSESETVLFDSALEVLINLSITLGKDFGKIFASFSPVIQSNVKSKNKTKRVASIGCLAEMSISLKDDDSIMNDLLQLFISRLSNDVSLEVKGNAAYGVGLIIENNHQDFSNYYQNILELLFHLLSKTDKQASGENDEENKDVLNRAFANACGCVARLTLKNQQAIPLQHIIDPLLNHLPLQAAFEENSPIFKLILKLFEQQNGDILAKSDKIVEIFGKVFEKEIDVENLINNSTLGREEGLDRLKQFESEDLKNKVVELLKFINANNGSVGNHPVLKSII